MGGLVIYGAGGHALVVAEIVEEALGCDIVGFVDDDPALQDQSVGGYPVLGNGSILRGLLARGIGQCIIAIGNNSIRRKLALSIGGLGFELPTVIHPSAQISNRSIIGEGSVVEACAVIKTGARIGRLAIINSCTSVGPDAILGEAVQISPKACIADGVKIGDGTQVGIGACVLPGVRIGADTIVGAGAAVMRDLPDGVVAVGVPARIVRQR